MFFQSKRIVPVRKRTSPSETPFDSFGKPPAKSKRMLALVCAPRISGPKASSPICDWRSEPPNEPADSNDCCWHRDFGNVHAIQVSAHAKHIQKHDAGKPDPIFGSAFNFGLALLLQVCSCEILILFNLGDAIFDGAILRSGNLNW